MKVTKKMIQELYSTQRVEQVDNKQLFIVNTNYLGRILVSYKTTIGIYFDGCWVITLEKFSQTTSKQINQFIEGNKHLKVMRVNPETFDDFMMAISKV